jgi:Na+-driven multidrug efflux pump
MNVSRSVPSLLLRKFMGLCTEHNPEATLDDALAGHNAVIRIYAIADCVRLAISTGLLPAASYAYASHQIDRFFALVGHACWINLIWGLSTCAFTTFGGKYLAMSISSSPTYLRWAVPMMKEYNWEAPYTWLRNVIQTTLQALQYGKLASIYSFTTSFIGSLGATFLLYHLDNSSFIKLMWSYPIGSAFSAGVGLIVVIYPLRKLYKSRSEYKGKIGADGAGESALQDAAEEMELHEINK